VVEERSGTNLTEWRDFGREAGLEVTRTKRPRSKCPQGTTRQLKRLATTAGGIGTPQTSNAGLEHQRPGLTGRGNRKGGTGKVCESGRSISSI